jgi:hypothetical protein
VVSGDGVFIAVDEVVEQNGERSHRRKVGCIDALRICVRRAWVGGSRDQCEDCDGRARPGCDLPPVVAACSLASCPGGEPGAAVVQRCVGVALALATTPCRSLRHPVDGRRGGQRVEALAAEAGKELDVAAVVAMRVMAVVVDRTWRWAQRVNQRSMQFDAV